MSVSVELKQLAPSLNGVNAGPQFKYSELTDKADPGAGFVRFNNSALASITEAYFDDLAYGGGDVSGWLDSFDTNDSGTKGYMFVSKLSDPANAFLIARCDGVSTDETGYWSVSGLTTIASVGDFEHGDVLGVFYTWSTLATSVVRQESSRANLVTYTGTTNFSNLNDGAILSDGTHFYVKNTGSTAISDMSDVDPYGNDAWLAQFGAVGDTVISSTGTLTSGTNDDTAIAAAIDWMDAQPGRKIHGDPGKIYLVAAEHTTAGDLRFEGHGCKFFKDSSGRILTGAAPVNFYDLSANYAEGDTTISVNSTGTALEPGQMIVIVSDAITPYNRDEGSGTNQYRVAEYAFVGEGSTTTSIALLRPLRRPFGQDPADANITNAGAEETIVDAFTTALNARVAVIDFKDMDISGVRFEYASGHGSGSGDEWGGDALTLHGYRGTIRDIHVDRGYDAGISIIGCESPGISNCIIRNLENDTSNGFFGYGINNNSFGAKISNCVFKNLRHGHKPGPGGCSADDQTFTAVSQAGAEAFVVRDCEGLSCEAAPFDFHHGSFGGKYVDCYAEGCSSFGFGMRGRDCTIVRPMVRNCKGGVIAFTDFASGSTNDDLWLAGKSKDYFTSGLVIDPDIECITADHSSDNEAPFYVRYATLRIAGHSKSHTNSVTCIHGNGAVFVDGSIDHKVTTFNGAVSIQSQTTRAAFHWNDGDNADGDEAFADSKLVFGDGAEVTVDMANATGTVPRLIDCQTGAEVELNGRIFATMASGQQILAGGGTIKTFGDGIIEWEVDGAADNTVAEAATSFDCTMMARDGAAYWYAAKPDNQLQCIYSDQSVTTIAGTGSEQANQYIMPLSSTLDKMETDGAGRISIRQVFIKDGTTGGATLKYDTYGGFFSQIALNASSNMCILQIDINVYDTDDYYYSAHWQENENTTFGAESRAGSNTVAGGVGSGSGNFLDLDPTITSGDTVRIISTEVWANVGGVL